MYGTGLAKGLMVTMKNVALPSRLFTTHQYPNRRIGLLGLAQQEGTNILSYALANPRKAAMSLMGLVSVEDRLPQHPRFRGEEFTWHEERCTGCASCAKYCPLGIIRIVTHPSDTNIPEGATYAIDVFDIDIGRCMFCGLCVEACPYDAIHMGSGFEEGGYTRSELVITVDDLREAPKRPSTFIRPQIEAQSYNPFSGQELSWRNAGRHDVPTEKEFQERWVKR